LETGNRCRFPGRHLLVGTNDPMSLVPVVEPAPLCSPRSKKNEEAGSKPSRADAFEPHHSSRCIPSQITDAIPRLTTTITYAIQSGQQQQQQNPSQINNNNHKSRVNNNPINHKSQINKTSKYTNSLRRRQCATANRSRGPLATATATSISLGHGRRRTSPPRPERERGGGRPDLHLVTYGEAAHHLPWPPYRRRRTSPPPTHHPDLPLPRSGRLR
jgi:hypothetical protein